jgi:PGF-pre-PGF domain-containing protein
MKRTLLVVALLLIAAGTVMATGAVPFDGPSDDLDAANDSGVVLAPADTANGDRYAELDDAGELNVTLDAIAGSTTRINDVFELGFEGRTASDLPANITIEYDSDRITILRMDTDEPVGSETIMLEPNESITLGFEIGGDLPDGGSFVEPVTYRATVPNSIIEIRFDTGGDDDRTVSIIDPSEDFDETSDPNLTVPPRAIINRTTGDGSAFANEITSNRTEFEGVTADAVIQTGETISLSGSRSLVDTSYAIDINRRLVSLFDIPVSEAEANESATINVPLDAEQFNGTDPSEATLARLTDDDWQSLPTTVNESADEGVPGRVVLQARTPGFSVFGVFAQAETTYLWESDGETTEGRTASFSFDEPGMHRINLTITDAFGQSNTTTYRVLANDPPSVDIEPEVLPVNETIRLRADVTNVVGEETITWRFEDGTTATGQEINRSFERDEIANVTVEDEFGATGTDEAVAGLQGANPILNVFQWQLGFEGRIAVVLVLSILIIGIIRWVIAERYYRSEERSDDRDLI